MEVLKKGHPVGVKRSQMMVTGKDIIQGMAEYGGEETRKLSALLSCHQPL